jgi:hypothetical protein
MFKNISHQVIVTITSVLSSRENGVDLQIEIASPEFRIFAPSIIGLLWLPETLNRFSGSQNLKKTLTDKAQRNKEK